MDLLELRFDTFLDAVYYAMLTRLPYDDTRDLRAEIDQTLLVREWLTPMSNDRPRPVVTEGPSWWRGDEDASQQFLHEMGISLDGG